MTVAELKKLLEGVPDYAEVRVIDTDSGEHHEGDISAIDWERDGNGEVVFDISIGSSAGSFALGPE